MDYDKNDFTSLVHLLVEQQREIKGLIEDFAKDLIHLKERSEDIPILVSQFDNIKKDLDNEKKLRTECQGKVETKISEGNQKKEQIRERLNNLENDFNQKLFYQSRYCSETSEKLRKELEEKIESKCKPISDSIKESQQDIKKLTGEAGKTGGIVAVIISIVMYLLKTLYDHAVSK
jgi:DNA repair exonuclease SbcCD ATPase subunit